MLSVVGLRQALCTTDEGTTSINCTLLRPNLPAWPDLCASDRAPGHSQIPEAAVPVAGTKF